MHRRSGVFLSVLILLVCNLPSVHARVEIGRTVLDGVYSASQATRGKRAYARHCIQCHESDLEGGALEPPLVSVLFLDAWREDYLDSLYDFIATRMPKLPVGEPGSASEREYIEILAYILAENGFPSGSVQLTRADLRSTLLVGPHGPEPLPPNAMVRSAGCFAAMPEGGWALERATAPARVREGSDTNADELAGSRAAPAGDWRFALNNMEEHGDAEIRTELLGGKVQVKGVLNGQGAEARIYVLSLETLGLACTE